jgi:mono/diheme cytochrome c family protein
LEGAAVQNFHVPSVMHAVSLHRQFFVLAIVLLIASSPMAMAATASTDEGAKLFRERIQPVLEKNCYECHSANAKKVKGDLLLDTRAGMRKGGETGPAIVPNDVTKSILLQAIKHSGDLKMPPKKPKLSDEVIADFVKWVQVGAPDPRDGGASAADPYDFKKAREFWSFKPVKVVAPPSVKDSSWYQTPIDRFVLAKLEENGLRPAPMATKAELVRRVYYDLTGLPPSPDEVKEFLADKSADAYERLVDRLLDNPKFGERMAQSWLDVVRYAESEGFEYDRHIPDAWRYRDYVIGSFNRDKPFDQFVTEQIAGDEMAPENQECEAAAIFHRLGAVRRNAGNPEIALSRNEVLTERTDIIGAAFLGLTVGCARCHNHKFDPILQKDYYALQAYFAASQENDIVLGPPELKKQWEEKTKAANAELKKLRKLLEQSQGEERKKLSEKIEKMEDEMPAPPPTIPTVHNDFAQRTEMHVLKRGDWEKKGELVAPHPPTVLCVGNANELAPDAPKPRTELARWLTSAKNPLTARVIVNRVWQNHFGLGFVKTSNDFGKNGERPTHPELLDWLASRLIEDGWRLKGLHRMILLSAAYQQSSKSALNEIAMRADPDNRLLWHFSRRRLTAEEIRDSMLSISGQLNLKTGGRSVMVPVDRELVQLLYKPSQWEVSHNTAENNRRSIYLIAKRNLHLPFMETFDQPALLTSCGRRESSTHAPQALEMLNGELANNLAGAFAARLNKEAGTDRDKIITRAYELALSHAPTKKERALAVEFLKQQPLKEFALAIFNLNDFLYVR